MAGLLRRNSLASLGIWLGLKLTRKTEMVIVRRSRGACAYRLLHATTLATGRVAGSHALANWKSSS